MSFQVSGKGDTGIFRYSLTIIMVLLFGMIFTIYQINEEGFSIYFLIIPVPFLGICIFLFFYLMNALKMKSIIIKDGLVSYLINGKVKNKVYLKDITEVYTVHPFRGRDSFGLMKGKEIVLQCGGLQDLELPKLIAAFNEIIKYKNKYNFIVNDSLKWEGKEKIGLIEKI